MWGRGRGLVALSEHGGNFWRGTVTLPLTSIVMGEYPPVDGRGVMEVVVHTSMSGSGVAANRESCPPRLQWRLGGLKRSGVDPPLMSGRACLHTALGVLRGGP